MDVKDVEPGMMVKCIDAVESEGHLKANCLYRVERVTDGGLVILKDLPEDVGWYADRFVAWYDDPDFEGPPAPDNFKATNPKDAAASNRLDLSLVPASATIYTALALTEGHFKYGGYNWRVAGALASVYYSATMRHMTKWYNGEDSDPETQVPHLASALACLAILADSVEMGMLKDDRPPAVPTNDLLKACQVVVEHLRGTFPKGPGRHTEYGSK